MHGQATEKREKNQRACNTGDHNCHALSWKKLNEGSMVLKMGGDDNGAVTTCQGKSARARNSNSAAKVAR